MGGGIVTDLSRGGFMYGLDLTPEGVTSISFTGAGPHLIGASGLVLLSNSAAASTASDVTINTNVTRTDGKLLDIKNNGTTKCYVNNNGTIVSTYSGNATVMSGAIESNRADRLALWASSGGATLALGAELKEQTPPAGVANAAILFAKDNGSGKTQLMVIFGTGAAQQVSIEP